MSSRQGLLICNIGTPRSPSTQDVASYLREFLMDKEIINLPWPLRWLLVHLVIVPRRAPYSAHNYKSIWTDEGSPLMVLTKKFQAGLKKAIGDRYVIEIGMSFGEPSIKTAMTKLKQQGVEEVLVMPMYPQYARVTTEANLQAVRSLNQSEAFHFKLCDLKPYYHEKSFVAATAELVENHPGAKKRDHLLMTYHGLPQSQLRKKPGCLASADCCQQAGACEKPCYRAQCLATSTKLVDALKLKPGQWSVSFQSRLGRAEWIQPYTEDVLKELAQKGVRHLAVLCPSFSVDCLETLEEIGIQGAKAFKQAGGESFELIPCLNERCDYLLPLIEKSFSAEKER